MSSLLVRFKTGCWQDFVASWQAWSSDFPAIHCIIHQEALLAHAVNMPHVMETVVKTVYFIRSRYRNHRKFRAMQEEIGSDFDTLPYFTKVRWLSRGKVLNRYALIQIPPPPDIFQYFPYSLIATLINYSSLQSI